MDTLLNILLIVHRHSSESSDIDIDHEPEIDDTGLSESDDKQDHDMEYTTSTSSASLVVNESTDDNTSSSASAMVAAIPQDPSHGPTKARISVGPFRQTSKSLHSKKFPTRTQGSRKRNFIKNGTKNLIG